MSVEAACLNLALCSPAQFDEQFRALDRDHAHSGLDLVETLERPRLLVVELDAAIPKAGDTSHL